MAEHLKLIRFKI